ncbi:pyruvate kinase [Arthrobacter sp. Soil736]|uniref:PEP/pyruvate-binding domain-containing protein n=1 Tax=Arthrobacter sp. Soil736 TaxID=1736395 RepID=UPI0006F74551|nr:PEP/pyruvate-binding domain-containing protein [Arthrobacter sp. Soil736]KRE53205.1 pyruvate kinase [Arthrobacter sp. Soil736]
MSPPESGTPDRLVLELGQLGSEPLTLVGGKALNLGRLADAGFPVPAGFCLTTAAYRMAVPPELDALAARLDGLAAGAAHTGEVPATGGPDGNEPAQREGALREDAQREIAMRARELVGTSPVPPEVEAAVRRAYAAMGDVSTPAGSAPAGSEPAGSPPAVAVRSSATAEDLPFASFAGQQDSFLNIVGADAVMQAVRRCWASLWTDRAVAYRSANGIRHSDVGLAVVVQHVVDATTAGVLFSANPVTGTRGETVIDASAGPGEAVVSGAVTPDHFVVETATGRIRQSSPRPVDAGTGDGGSPGLTDAQLRELTSLGLSAQELFGEPQDVEWVIDAEGTIWLTQSRPITTLYPLPDPSSAKPFGLESAPDGETRVYLCGTLLQGLTRPLTPMGLSVMGMMGNRSSPWAYVSPGLRMYADLTPFVRTAYGRRMLLKWLPLADGRSASVLPALLDDPRFGLTKGQPRPSKARASEARRRDGTAGLAMVVWLVPALIRAVLRPKAELHRALRFGKRLEADLALPEPATAFRRLDHAQHAPARTVDDLVRATLPAPAAGYAMLGLARWLLRGVAEPRELEAVLRGLPHNVTTEMDLELWRLAVSVRDDAASREAFLGRRPDELAVSYAAGELPPVAQAGLRRFLERYGHRAVAEIDLGMPRWSEKPDHILGMISNYLKVENPELAPDRQFARAADHAEARIRSLVARAGAVSRWRGRLVALCLRRTRQLAGLRELPKFYVVTVFGEVHRQLAAIGAELARAGTIVAADDVFFLTFDEARVGLRGGELKGMVAERRRIYDAELRRRHIPRLLLSDGTDVEAAVAGAAAASSLVGTPASAGKAAGRVRVILDPVGAHLEPGEILVAPSTDPGWTPLFMTAGALVMEMGGVISHGAVVAREYGIPAVVGVPHATTRLRTGQTVVVDGAAGTITEVETATDVGTVTGVGTVT